MVAEPWIFKIGSQVSNNSRNFSSNKKKQGQGQKSQQEKQIIGILSFEVANVMSKIIHLHKSLADNEMLKLKNEILKHKGIKILVCDNEIRLLELALVEKLDDLNRVASVVSRLGKKCTLPALQGFEHVYSDIVSGVIDVTKLGFLVKDMENMIRKFERYINSTASLYGEMEVLNELELATKKFQQNQHEESRKAFEQKVVWQKQDVKHLKDVSVWNQTYDKMVELLARTVCTVYSRILVVFGDAMLKRDYSTEDSGQNSLKKPDISKSNSYSRSGPLRKASTLNNGLQRNESNLFNHEDLNFPCGIGPGRMLMECLNLSSSASKVDDEDDRNSQISGCFSVASTAKRDYTRAPPNNTKFGPKSKITVHAPPSTIGGSALSLHYANVIIVIEKFLQYPHLVGEEARDDLYQMLPTSLRKTLKTNLKSSMKNLAIYDAPLAHNWKEQVHEILKWLGPLAHNMIRWQSERNVEQQQIVKRTNVLLLETLYFADRGKTERAICEMLVGLNYICRYEQQQNALLDCASSFDLEDCMEWQMQFGASFHS